MLTFRQAAVVLCAVLVRAVWSRSAAAAWAKALLQEELICCRGACRRVACCRSDWLPADAPVPT